jgi:serine/threonine-protein kinase
MPPSSLHGWLLDIARALDFIHDQHHIHRDVKPANILFDTHGNAFLGDFGIIKAPAADAEGRLGNTTTAPGFLMGTPNYVAPEIVMGRPFDGRVDQYALAMTLHEVLSGTNCMTGACPSATMVNQTTIVPPPLTELVPRLSRRLSDVVARALSKDPEDRFESCAAMAHAVLAEIPLPAAPVSFTVVPNVELPEVWFPPVLEAKAGGGASQRGRGIVVGLAAKALVLIGAVLGGSF